MDWTPTAITTLRTLWAAGISTAKIGERMGCSKDAVIGKANRLELPRRASPIKRSATPKPPPKPKIPRVTGPTLPPMEAPPPVKEAPAVHFSSSRRCQFIAGTPAGKDTVFCDDPVEIGRSFCPKHLALCYQKVNV